MPAAAFGVVNYFTAATVVTMPEKEWLNSEVMQPNTGGCALLVTKNELITRVDECSLECGANVMFLHVCLS